MSRSETSDAVEEVDNDETPLLNDQIEEARGLINSENNLSLEENSTSLGSGNNMVVRLLRSIRRFSRRNLRRSDNLSDYGSDDDEEPLIIRTTLRRQGAIRRANIES